MKKALLAIAALVSALVWAEVLQPLPGEGDKKPEVFISQMEKVGDGFEEGCWRWERSLGAMTDGVRRRAERELGTYRAARLHFRSVADQARFVLARDRGDTAEMKRIAAREAETAKTLLPLVRRDSRIGYECSNHYFYVPQDLIEKVLCCRMLGVEPL